MPRASPGRALFRDYIAVQLQHLIDDYGVDVSVGRSSSEIPYPYVIDDSGIEVGNVSTTELSRWFPSNELVHIGDEVADGVWPLVPYDRPPAGLVRRAAHRLQPGAAAALHRHPGRAFPAFRAVHQLCPLRRRVRRFRDRRAAPQGRRVQGAVGARRAVRAAASSTMPRREIAAGRWRRHQMPAYHLMADDGQGITLVNIGVGPSNAKTICDHIAVLRPEVWLMIGHCGGPAAEPVDRRLRPRPRLSARRSCARRRASGRNPDSRDRRGPEGVVRGGDDRHRRGRGQRQAPASHRHGGHHRRPQLGASLHRSRRCASTRAGRSRSTWNRRPSRRRAIASGCPTGRLLCVSDKPLHGELKLPGQANAFYERAISQHLRIGIEAIALAEAGRRRAPQPQARSFDEPPLR